MYIVGSEEVENLLDDLLENKPEEVNKLIRDSAKEAVKQTLNSDDMPVKSGNLRKNFLTSRKSKKHGDNAYIITGKARTVPYGFKQNAQHDSKAQFIEKTGLRADNIIAQKLRK